MRTCAMAPLLLLVAWLVTACQGGGEPAPTPTPTSTPTLTPTPRPPEITTPLGALFVTGAEEVDEYPPGCWPLDPNCGSANPGYKLLVVHLEPVDKIEGPLTTEPSGVAEWVLLLCENAYVVARDGSKAERATIFAHYGPPPDSQVTEVDLVFAPPVEAADFALYCAGNAPVFLPRTSAAGTPTPSPTRAGP
jgi:hypothetical protein